MTRKIVQTANSPLPVGAYSQAVISDAGSNMDRVVKINLYLADISDSAIVNDIYSRRFMAPFPARSAVAVSNLPLGALVEIEAVAALKEEQY